MKTWGGMTSPSLDMMLRNITMVGKLMKSLSVALSYQSTAFCYFSGHLLNLCEVFWHSRKR